MFICICCSHAYACSRKVFAFERDVLRSYGDVRSRDDGSFDNVDEQNENENEAQPQPQRDLSLPPQTPTELRSAAGGGEQRPKAARRDLPRVPLCWEVLVLLAALVLEYCPVLYMYIVRVLARIASA